MTIKQALIIATQKLKTKKILSPRLDAEVLLAFVLKKDKAFLYTYPQKALTASQLKKFNQLISKRLKYWPVAYLASEKEFYKLPFKVNQKVLIPRPETELMVDEILKLNKKWTVADIGTGSGNIAIALIKNGFQKVYATDISNSILNLAKQNAKLNKVLEKIKFFKGNLIKPLQNKKIDIIAANLPYLSQKVYKSHIKMYPSLKHEPKNALIAPLEGLFYFQQLFEQIINAKHKPKYLFLEIDPDQPEKIKRLIKNYFAFPAVSKLQFRHSGLKSIQVKKDLCGKKRLVIVKL